MTELEAAVIAAEALRTEGRYAHQRFEIRSLA